MQSKYHIISLKFYIFGLYFIIYSRWAWNNDKCSINSKYFLIHSNMFKSVLYDQKNRFHVGLDCTCIGTYHCNYIKTWKLINLEASTISMFWLIWFPIFTKNKRKQLLLNSIKLPKSQIDRNWQIADALPYQGMFVYVTQNG